MIRELYDHGMSISEISGRLHIDRKTARKYAKSKDIPRFELYRIYSKLQQYNYTTSYVYRCCAYL